MGMTSTAKERDRVRTVTLPQRTGTIVATEPQWTGHHVRVDHEGSDQWISWVAKADCEVLP